MNVLTKLGQRNAEVQRQANRFRNLFGMPLSRFWHPLTGFDIVRFDDAVKPGKNQSLRERVEVKYGTEAVQFIEMLIRA